MAKRWWIPGTLVIGLATSWLLYGHLLKWTLGSITGLASYGNRNLSQMPSPRYQPTDGRVATTYEVRDLLPEWEPLVLDSTSKRYRSNAAPPEYWTSAHELVNEVQQTVASKTRGEHVNIFGRSLSVIGSRDQQARVVEFLDSRRRRIELISFLIRAVPLCVSLMIASIVMRIAILSLVEARRRRLRHCLACGYDLRATPDRCPECGTFVTSPLTA